MNSSPQIAQMGVLSLVSDSGLVAKLILLILLGASIFCWSIIMTKWRSLQLALQENAKFLNVFWHGKSIDEIFAKSDKFPRSPVAAIFKSGVKELKKVNSTESEGTFASAGTAGVDNIYRSLSRSASAEIAVLEKHISWLATVASASPFVGLFGTVWGIMNSFHSIGATGAANLAVVAPGISEALITTAAGIAAAIPAVVAYNYFSGQIRKVGVDMECFTQDFLNIVQRSMMAGK